MQNLNDDKLYSDDVNFLTFTSFNINTIKDYDNLDIKIINSLKKYNNSSNLVDMLLDNIQYDKLSNNEYGILLDNISNNKVSKIIDIILHQ
jgi:hypothetical protein